VTPCTCSNRADPGRRLRLRRGPPAGGHVLAEDVPGSGKTTLAPAFAGTLGGDVRRIQGTADQVVQAECCVARAPDGREVDTAVRVLSGGGGTDRSDVARSHLRR
jgi:hypothetical protein